MQTTNRLLMVRPVRFAFNEETAANNAFQHKSESMQATLQIQQEAVREFDAYVGLLRENGVIVDVLQDTEEPFTPDSIFPNNCFSTHIGQEHILVLYPMFACNRRKERDKLLKMVDMMKYDRVVDLTSWEQKQCFLEGTGSLVLDREHRIAYACASPRTSEVVLKEWAAHLDYRYLLFDSVDEKGIAVYHTNVLMHVGTDMAVVCLESIRDMQQRESLVRSLTDHGKEIVPITYEQMNHFAGNMLEVRSSHGEKILVMSKTARESLTEEQLLRMQKYVRIISPDIHVIESAGGGSARCMMAELF